MQLGGWLAKRGETRAQRWRWYEAQEGPRTVYHTREVRTADGMEGTWQAYCT